eukprot:COSAG05_NODE_3872_length_1796_cov_4.811082_2_plen_79_part_00
MPWSIIAESHRFTHICNTQALGLYNEAAADFEAVFSAQPNCGQDRSVATAARSSWSAAMRSGRLEVTSIDDIHVHHNW